MGHLKILYMGFVALFIFGRVYPQGGSRGHQAGVAQTAEEKGPLLVGFAVPDVHPTTAMEERYQESSMG